MWTDVPVSPSSSVAVMSEALLSDSGWEIVELGEIQEDMNYDGTPVKAPPTSRRKIMPPTPQQSLQSSIGNTGRRIKKEWPTKSTKKDSKSTKTDCNNNLGVPGEMGGALENVGCAGKGMPGTQGRN